MKKINSLTLLLSVFAFIVHSQHRFAPLNAEWWYYNSVTDGMFTPFPGAVTNTTFHTRAASDTVIDGRSCIRLTTEYRSLTNRPNTPSPSSGFLKEFYFYSNTDTTFIFNDNFNRFTPLYVFNADEGDTICLPVPPSNAPDMRINPIAGDTSFCFIIDSIRVLPYDTAPLRTYYTRAIVKDTGNIYLPAYPAYNWGTYFWDTTAQLYTGVYIEHIIGDFFPNRLVKPVPDIPVFNTYAPYGTLRCYTDSLYHLKLSAEACDSIPVPVPLSVEKINPVSGFARIYPNPATGEVHISLSRPAARPTCVLLHDLSGRQVRRITLSQNEQTAVIDLSAIAPGTYLMALEADARYYYKLVVIP